MAQLTLRLDAELVEQLKRVAATAGQSVNRYAGDVLRAAVDPELEGAEVDRLRARLGRAGVLVATSPVRDAPGDAEALAAARRRAGSGRSLADLVIEGRS
jgi:plasmid stability protein